MPSIVMVAEEGMVAEEETPTVKRQDFMAAEDFVMAEEGMPILKGHDFRVAEDKLINACYELCNLLAPKYCRLAFILPPSSTSIWNILEDDIDRLAQRVARPCPKKIEDILEFMEHFFAARLVSRMRHNFECLEGSYLGTSYSFRLGLAGLAEVVVSDLIDAHTCNEGGALYNFLGACADNVPATLMVKLEHIIEIECAQRELAKGDEWMIPKKTFRAKRQGDGSGSSGGDGGNRRERNDGNTGDGRGGADGGEGSSGGGDGGDGRGRHEASEGALEIFNPTGLLNGSMVAVEVCLPAFKTPPKGPGRKPMLARRSWDFEQNGAVEKPQELYSPWTSADAQEKVVLFHGTRSSSLTSFKKRGIRPPVRRNEFSFLPAFYVCNSLRYAYEHPLHNHPSYHPDPVSVLVFEVDVSVLHGESLVPSMGRAFSVKWLKADTEENLKEWAEFSLGNLKRELDSHDFDVVIGPVCIPDEKMERVHMMQQRVGGGVELTQVAFCSKCSREWLARCGRVVYCEKRAGE